MACGKWLDIRFMVSPALFIVQNPLEPSRKQLIAFHLLWFFLPKRSRRANCDRKLSFMIFRSPERFRFFAVHAVIGFGHLLTMLRHSAVSACRLSRTPASTCPIFLLSPASHSTSGCFTASSLQRLRSFSVTASALSSSKSTSSPEEGENQSRSITKKLVETEKTGDVLLIGLNRPEKRNCVNEATAKELLDAITEFENDKSVKVGVLYGKGGYFCAGWDLSALSGKDADWVKDIPAFPGPMGPTRNFIKKPLIAAIQGYAVAGGLELSLMCDVRFMEEDAIVGVFCRRYGVPLVDGGTVRLPALIGLSRALDLILTGRPVDAKEALQMGLVNRVVGRGSAIGEALKQAATIARFPQECMLADRESAYNSAFTASSFEDALVFEHEKGKQIIVNEAISGAKGFVSGLGKHGKFNFNAQKINDTIDSHKK